MKTVTTVLIALFLGAGWPVCAAVLSWNPNSPDEGIISYNIYERTGVTYQLVGTIPAPQTSFPLTNLTPTLHVFAVTAVNPIGESAISTEVVVDEKPFSGAEFSNFSRLAIISAKDGKGKSNPYPSTIVVSGVPEKIWNLQVRIHDLTHPTVADVHILLVGPKGQKALLMSDAGGQTAVSSIDLTFSDDAIQMLDPVAPASGVYKPTNVDPAGDKDEFPGPAPGKPYPASLAAFKGADANGTWKLFVLDEATMGTGTIAGGWSILINGQSTPVVTLGQATNISSTTATLTGTVNPMGQPSAWNFYVGLTLNYTIAQPPQDAGNGTAAVPVSLTLGGLQPNTTYHYQLVGQNGLGASGTNDGSFTTRAIPDSDGDGMPDDYELAYQLNPNTKLDANSDRDGDGVSARDEYLQGTNPLDPRSALHVIIGKQDDYFDVSFPTVLGKRYQLQRATSLLQPVWSAVQDGIWGSGQVVTVEDPAAGGLPARFYRVVLIY